LIDLIPQAGLQANGVPLSAAWPFEKVIGISGKIASWQPF
jgi:hypothetical protein